MVWICEVPDSSKRHSSTAVADSEYSEKFTPIPSQVAPCGYGFPGKMVSTMICLCAPTRSRAKIRSPTYCVRTDFFNGRTAEGKFSAPVLGRAILRIRMSLEAGETISDYEVLGLLGQGGMGAVYRVRNLISHREEAMKVTARADSDPHAQERFLREIRVQASLPIRISPKREPPFALAIESC